jgi:ATP-dependent Clp protease adaptor protein ClpS
LLPIFTPRRLDSAIRYDWSPCGGDRVSVGWGNVRLADCGREGGHGNIDANDSRLPSCSARKRRIIEAGIGHMSATEDEKWSVLLLNDDTTPMDFVVDVIEQVFDIDLENARHLMLRVHNEGAVECGAYSQEIAKAKAAQVMDLARVHRHPLQCVVEREP